MILYRPADVFAHAVFGFRQSRRRVCVDKFFYIILVVILLYAVFFAYLKLLLQRQFLRAIVKDRRAEGAVLFLAVYTRKLARKGRHAERMGISFFRKAPFHAFAERVGVDVKAVVGNVFFDGGRKHLSVAAPRLGRRTDERVVIYDENFCAVGLFRFLRRGLYFFKVGHFPSENGEGGEFAYLVGPSPRAEGQEHIGAHKKI